MTTTSYALAQRQVAAAWKQRTEALPEGAKAPASFVGQNGQAGGPAYDFCLPPALASHNLLPEVRGNVLDLFAELGIPWHCGVDGGPGNHLLSSQVMCANALGQMVSDPIRLKSAFGTVLDIDTVLEIEPGRFLTFEYVGPHDYFGEGAGKARTRGANCTSVDAAFLFRNTSGGIELALVEWKYVESYSSAAGHARRDAVRRSRYHADWAAFDGPIRWEALGFDHLLVEPFYQLFRQQLLAHRLETDPSVEADVVRVVHVAPEANAAYAQSLPRPEHRLLGESVYDAWRSLLRRPDRFLHVSPRIFCDPAITSDAYVDRYGDAEDG